MPLGPFAVELFIGYPQKCIALLAQVNSPALSQYIKNKGSHVIVRMVGIYRAEMRTQIQLLRITVARPNTHGFNPGRGDHPVIGISKARIQLGVVIQHLNDVICLGPALLQRLLADGHETLILINRTEPSIFAVCIFLLHIGVMEVVGAQHAVLSQHVPSRHGYALILHNTPIASQSDFACLHHLFQIFKGHGLQIVRAFYPAALRRESL